MVALVLGGVRSGKSRYAQRLAEGADRVVFLATGQARDDAEMREKIERHKADRPGDWMVVEEPIELARVLRENDDGVQVIVIDCLTFFAANLLERFGDGVTAAHGEVERLCSALEGAKSSVILVSNEVGSGVVPAYASGRRFRDLVGEINQRVASVASDVVYMVAGLPMVLKGETLR